MLIARLALALAILAVVSLALTGHAGIGGPNGHAGTGPGGHAATATFSQPGAAMDELSPNWGGYVATGTTFRYVTVTFNVSVLDCAKTPGTAKNPTLVGEWVGLDSTTVEQDGIEGECDGFHAEYSAWYEMYPKPAVYPDISVSGGDTIQASVRYVASKDEYEVVLTDLANNQGFTVWARCGKRSCTNSSAEVITEAPGKPSGGYFPLADSGTISYTNIAVTDAAGQLGTFTSADWQTTRFVMEDGSGRVKTAIGDLTDNGAAFDTFWKRET